MKRAQSYLAKLRYYAGAIDGVAGKGTRSAVRGFQRENFLEETGVLDTFLLDRLEWLAK